MSEQEKKERGLLGGIGAGADVVVGDVILGGLGQGAHYLSRLPGMGNAMRYVGENVTEGWNKADVRQQKGIAVRLIQEVSAAKESPDSSTIHDMCVEAGVSEANLAEVGKAAQMAIDGKAAAIASLERAEGPETTPAASPSQEVQLPGGGTLQPATG